MRPSAEQKRAKRTVERLLTAVAQDQPLPPPATKLTDSTPEELRASLVVALAALDELYETGDLQPSRDGRLLETIRNLLLVLDGVCPLPEDWVLKNDLVDVLGPIRAARDSTTL